MKNFFGIVISTWFLLVGSSCLKRCEIQPSEGSDARDAMKSTVKIYGKAIGHKKDLFSTEENKVLEEETIEWTGSGVVVENMKDTGESLILSAEHVINEQKVSLHAEGGLHAFEIDKIEIIIETLNGARCEAEPIVNSKSIDLSVIKSNCIAGEASELADSLPPVGASVMVSGAGLGVHPANIFIVTDGRFMGVDMDADEEILTLPVASGHSGSGVFYKGKVFGIVSRRAIKFEHISVCVTLEHIKETLSIAKKMLKLKRS